MHQVEIDILEPEALQARFDLTNRVLGARVELCRDEDVATVEATLPKTFADTLLVAVALSGVDVAITQLERPADRVLRLAALGGLPDTQGERGNLIPVAQRLRRHRLTKSRRCRHIS